MGIAAFISFVLKKKDYLQKVKLQKAEQDASFLSQSASSQGHMTPVTYIILWTRCIFATNQMNIFFTHNAGILTIDNMLFIVFLLTYCDLAYYFQLTMDAEK